MTLIENWRQFWRMSSVWFQTAAAIFISYLTAVPDAAIQIWSVLPADLRAAVPPTYVQFGTVALIAIGVIARLVKQPKLAAEKAGMGQPPGDKPGVPKEGL